MKLQITLLYLCVVLSIGCAKTDLPGSFPKTANKMASTSAIMAAPVYSTDFDWENSTTVNIHGANIVLPWVGGANTAIPTYILEEMTKANGWDLYYNFPGWENSAANQNYLIFHNKFTGILRVFVYNVVNTTDNTQGVFNIQVEGPNPTPLLSMLQPLIATVNTQNPSAVLTNITDLPYSGFRQAWNVFDVPLTFDPQVSPNHKLKLSVSTDQKTVSDIVLTGTFSADSKGQLITTSESNPLTGVVNGISKAGGDKAKNWLKGKITANSARDTAGILGLITSNAPNLIQKLVSSGLKGIFSSFIGGFGSTTNSVQSINISTQGKLNVNGTLLTGNPGVINSFKSVALPGTDYSDGGFLPAKADRLGSWGVANVPIVLYSKRAMGQRQDFFQNYSLDGGSINVIFNEQTLAAIESHTVQAELWYYDKYNGSAMPDFAVSTNPQYPSISYLYVGQDGGEGMYSDSENAFFRNVFRLRMLNEQHYEMGNSGYVTLNVNAYKPGFVVKVTVTVIPKAPYNTNPIVMTRSYIPKYVGIN